LFRVEQERENLWVYDEWNSMEPGRSNFNFHEIFYLADVECRRNIRRQIGNLPFMKKAWLHHMTGSPVHCPPVVP
jgi:hypothetical protein